MSSSSDNVDIEAGTGTGFLSKEKRKEQESVVFTSNSSGRDSKFFRLFTVVLYVSMVSGLGLMLSMYHFFVWDSTMPPIARVPGHEIY